MSRPFDLVCCSIGLPILLPALVAISLGIRLDDGESILYSQGRVGSNFRRFRLFKFRTMKVDAEGIGTLTLPHDQRITRVGRFLRKYKLDELPQLINVLKGEMQLVGPRPEVQRYVEIFPDEYAVLLEEAPGLTDPASLAYIDESSHFSNAEEMEKEYVSKILPDKLRLSLEYQRRRTFLSDVKVICRTLQALFSSRHSSSIRHSYN